MKICRGLRGININQIREVFQDVLNANLCNNRYPGRKKEISLMWALKNPKTTSTLPNPWNNQRRLFQKDHVSRWKLEKCSQSPHIVLIYFEFSRKEPSQYKEIFANVKLNFHCLTFSNCVIPLSVRFTSNSRHRPSAPLWRHAYLLHFVCVVSFQVR